MEKSEIIIIVQDVATTHEIYYFLTKIVDLIHERLVVVHGICPVKDVNYEADYLLICF